MYRLLIVLIVLIAKFESRFTATVAIVHNLALLAGLLITCTHSLTRSRTCTHILTPAYINNITQSHIHSQSHTRTLIHTVNS